MKPRNWQRLARLGLMWLAGWAASGCTRDVIPNTDVEDTSRNREVIEFVETYRRAVEERDLRELMAMASESYYDDNGTPSGDDDIDYEDLKERLGAWAEAVTDVRYEIRYRRVHFQGARVLVDFTYSGSFQLETPEGEKWSRRIADNRLVLVREEEDQYRILTGM